MPGRGPAADVRINLFAVYLGSWSLVLELTDRELTATIGDVGLELTDRELTDRELTDRELTATIGDVGLERTVTKEIRSPGRLVAWSPGRLVPGRLVPGRLGRSSLGRSSLGRSSLGRSSLGRSSLVPGPWSADLEPVPQAAPASSSRSPAGDLEHLEPASLGSISLGFLCVKDSPRTPKNGRLRLLRRL